MQIHIFKGPGRVFAFTTQPAGENLPQKYAPWTPFKTVELKREVQTPGVNVNECLDDIETYGVHVTEAHVRVTENAIR